MEARIIGEDFKTKLKMEYFPLGMKYSSDKPENALTFKKGGGCVVPMILAGAKGNTVYFDSESIGWDCSAFYLGYKDWIFDGIECFLSDVPVNNREPERFIKNPELAKKFIESLKPAELITEGTIFKPLEKYDDNEEPELVIFFVTADQLSALVFLIHYSDPLSGDIVTAQLMSGCGSVVTLPMKYKRNGETKAVIGMHDISVRAKIPKEIMTITLPYDLVKKLHADLENSFMTNGKWDIIKNRS